MVLKLNYVFMVIRYTALLIALAVVVFFVFFNKAHAFYHPMEVELDHMQFKRMQEQLEKDGSVDIPERYRDALERAQNVQQNESKMDRNEREEPSHSRD